MNEWIEDLVTLFFSSITLYDKYVNGDQWVNTLSRDDQETFFLLIQQSEIS